jgi:hypothetical protein
MTEAQVELAKRAVACKGWRWMPGMRGWNPVGENWFRVADDAGILCASPYLVTFEGRHANGSRWASLSGCSPDLTDPATSGCLLALVREAWGDSEMHMALGAKGWVWLTGESRAYDVVMPINAGATEAEALVAALEAAL